MIHCLQPDDIGDTLQIEQTLERQILCSLQYLERMHLPSNLVTSSLQLVARRPSKVHRVWLYLIANEIWLRIEWPRSQVMAHFSLKLTLDQ